MRYAMSVPVTDFMKKSIDMGGLAQSGTALRSAIDNAGISLQGDVGAAGITSQADVEATKLVGAAQKAVASAEQNAAMMGMLGKIGGGLVSGIGSNLMNNTTGGTFKYRAGPGSAPGTNMGSGVGVVGGYGTFGPNYGFKVDY